MQQARERSIALCVYNAGFHLCFDAQLLFFGLVCFLGGRGERANSSELVAIYSAAVLYTGMFGSNGVPSELIKNAYIELSPIIVEPSWEESLRQYVHTCLSQ